MKNQNVMVILCDQLRTDYLSCYNEKSPVKTPNIDSLVGDGVIFEHSITASPVCAPGRACMMTGRYVSDHGVWTNDMPFREGIEFLPQRMKDNGYCCGAFGKLHHYPARDSKGFDVAWQMEENRLKEDDDYFKFIKERHQDETSYFANGKKGEYKYSSQEYYDWKIADKAMEFIEENKEKPLFSWVSFQGPHGPIDPPIDFEYKVKEEDIPEVFEGTYDLPCEVAKYRSARQGGAKNLPYIASRFGYAKLIEFIDFQVGRIITYLKENDLYHNTTIIFSTDHGHLYMDFGLDGKGPFIYSQQLEVPMIVANNANLPKNVRSDMLTGNLDIASTALSVAGDDRPLAYSRDIAKMFNDKSYQREILYSEFCDSMKIVCNKEFRMAYYPFARETELVRIGDESHNLANLPEYEGLKYDFMTHIMDFMVLSKGVKIEAWDLTPKVQQGLAEKQPNFRNEIPIVAPISNMIAINYLKEYGLDWTYNEFCKDVNVLRHYGVYWDKSLGTKHK